MGTEMTDYQFRLLMNFVLEVLEKSENLEDAKESLKEILKASEK